MSKEKFLITLTVLIDVIGIGVVIPVLPFYVARFDSSPLAVTALIAVFAFCSFISAPFLGAWSDRIGRRPILIISILSTAVGWLVFASAWSLTLLFIGRIIDGLAAGNFSTAQSYLTDIAKNEKERTANLGVVGATFGIGLIVGPAIGGFLGAWNHTLPFWFVGFLALINAALVYLFLPESKIVREKKSISLNPLRPLYRAFSDRKLLPGFGAWFLFGIAVAVGQSVFALYLGRAFGFKELAVGSLTTALGVVVALNQGVALKHFWLRRFSTRQLESGLMLTLALAWLIMGGQILWLFMVGLAIQTLTHSILRVTLTSHLSILGGPTRQGEILGILTSVMSLSMIIGPILAGALFKINLGWPYFLAAFCCFLCWLLIFRNQRRESQVNLPEDILIDPAA
jgi:multidrug resistance protein